MRENIHRTRSMPHILRRNQSQASEECYVSGSVRLPGDLAYAISQAPERTKTSYRSVDDSHPIHEDGFTLEAFRAGGPYLCTMPAHCGPSICPSRQEFFRGEQFRYTEDIKKILSRAGIPHFKTMGFLSRYSEFGSAQEPTMLTYLIDTREPFTNSWIDVCREIYEYFCQNGVPECAVEMVGKHAFVKDHFFPVRPEDPIYSRWYSILGDIFQRCILDHVNSIGCYRIGTTANWEDNPPTIFVTVNAHTDRDWRTFRENIVLILEDHDLPMVAVKIQADRILRGNALRKRDRMVPDAALERPAQVGHSVGMLNNSTGESGLFGGFLELRYPESEGWIPYGITSSRGLFSEGGGQVASPFNTSKSINFSKDTQLQAKGYIALRGWRCNGAHPKDTAAHCFLQVQQPSARDMEQHDKYCDEQMQEIVDVENHIHHHYQQKKSQVEKFRQADNHHIGSVFAASWERVKSSVAMPSAAMQGPGCEMEMDWALIEVPGHRMGDNNISDLGPFRGIQSHIPIWKSVRDPVPPGLKVYKCVYNTAQSQGIYHGLMTAHINHELVDGVDIPRCTWAHTITGRPMDDDPFPDPFWVPGESGAMITDPSGSVLGFLTGGNERAPVSYFSHVDDVFGDIKKVTGAAEVRVMIPPF